MQGKIRQLLRRNPGLGRSRPADKPGSVRAGWNKFWRKIQSKPPHGGLVPNGETYPENATGQRIEQRNITRHPLAEAIGQVQSDRAGLKKTDTQPPSPALDIPECTSTPTSIKPGDAGSTAGSDITQTTKDSYLTDFDKWEDNKDLDCYIAGLAAENMQPKCGKFQRLVAWITKSKLKGVLKGSGEQVIIEQEMNALGKDYNDLKAKKDGLVNNLRRNKTLERQTADNIRHLMSDVNQITRGIEKKRKKIKDNPTSRKQADWQTDLYAKLEKQATKSREIHRQISHRETVQQVISKNLADIAKIEGELRAIDAEKQKLGARLKEVNSIQDSIAEQIVTLMLNLRSIRQGKAAVGPVMINDLKIGNPPVEFKEISLWPTAIVSREEGDQHYVDIDFDKTHAVVKAPVDGVECVGVTVDVDHFRLTVGGEVAKGIDKYLKSSGIKNGLVSGMRSMISKGWDTIEALRGKGGIAPVEFSLRADNATVKIDGLKSDTVVRGVCMAGRNPANALHTMLAGLPLPVTAQVGNVKVETEGEVKVGAELKAVNLALKPDVSGKFLEGKRNAAIEVDAATAGVTVDAPLNLANQIVKKIKPDDPFAHLPEPLAFLASPSALEKLPENASQQLKLAATNVHASLVREVHNRPTKASNDPVWFVEGEGQNHVKADVLELVNHGDLAVTGQLTGVDLEIKNDNDQTSVAFVIDDHAVKGVKSFAQVECKPGMVPALEKTTGIKKLGQLQATGKVTLDMPGRTEVYLSPKRVSVEMSGLCAGAGKPVTVKTEDFQVEIPQDLNAEVKGFKVSSQQKQLSSDYQEHRVDTKLAECDVSGNGVIIVETGLKNEGGKTMAPSRYQIPIYGEGKIRDVGISHTTFTHKSGRRVRRAVMLRPRNIGFKDIQSGNIHLGRVELDLDKELDGYLKISDASVNFDDILQNHNVPQAGGETTQPQKKKNAIAKLLLRNKTLMMSGHLQVRKGMFNIKELAGVGIKVVTQAELNRIRMKSELEHLSEISPEKRSADEISRMLALVRGLKKAPRASLVDWLVCKGFNAVFRVATGLVKNGGIRVGARNGLPVIHSRLTGILPIPIPKKAVEFIGLGPNGVVNMPAAQSIHSGVFCFPASVEQYLNTMIDQVRTGSIAKLEGFKKEVQASLNNPAKVSEALYLLKMLPIEAFTCCGMQLKGGAINQLKKLASLASSRSDTASVAAAIYNDLSRLNIDIPQEEIDRLDAVISDKGMDKTELGELHYHQGNYDKAIAHLRSTVDTQPQNGRALMVLAQALWESGEREESLVRFREAAVAGEEGVIPSVEQLAKGGEGTAPDNKARLLLGALRLRDDAVNHNFSELKKGIHDLEQLLADDLYKNHARDLLVKRCDHAWKVKEKMDLEDWELWKKQISETVKAIKSRKRHRQLNEALYDMALSKMYCYKGIDQNLDEAELLFSAISHPGMEVNLHLEILRTVKAMRHQEKQVAA